MEVELAYGRKGLVVELPDELEVEIIRKRTQPVLADEAAGVRRALSDPVECAPLRRLASRCRSACILICDITRPVPNHLFLRPLVEEMLAAGIEAERITVLVATGLHRANLGKELESLVGDPWVLSRVNVVNHDARDAQMHVDLGRTSGRGTPVRLDRRFVEADLRIATGLVEPHFMAGYSGGRKVIAPGIAHEETIRTFHNGRFMEDPLATQCNLDGNPLHEEQLEIVSMLGPVYAVNTVINETRQLTFVNFGEIVASHLEAVSHAEVSSTVDVPRRFSTLVTSAAGYPLDRTYYQTVKGMVTPMDILNQDADLIVASDCSEGLGSDDFIAAQRRLVEMGPDAFMAELLSKELADVDEWQTEMQLKPMRGARIELYTEGLSAEERALTGVVASQSVAESVEHSVMRSGDRHVAVIPEGPYVVPRLVEP